MEIWIIQDGEKKGPLHDFEVRRKIGEKEFTASTPAWHEGMEGWKTLGEMTIFLREFELAAAPPRAAKETPIPTLSSPAPPPLPQQTHFVRRFWARWFDLTLYSGVWWLAMWFSGQNVGAVIVNPWIMFFQYVPWFVFETLLLHYRGTTPGKWLLGMRVANQDGSRMDLGQATRRSGRVLFAGIGFGWDLLALFCQTLSYFTARKLGQALWDHTGGHRVLCNPLGPLRVGAFVCLFFVAAQMQAIVIFPHFKKYMIRGNPALQELFEKYPPWHLPERTRPGTGD